MVSIDMWVLGLQDGLQRALRLWRAAYALRVTGGHLWQGSLVHEGRMVSDIQ